MLPNGRRSVNDAAVHTFPGLPESPADLERAGQDQARGEARGSEMAAAGGVDSPRAREHESDRTSGGWGATETNAVESWLQSVLKTRRQPPVHCCRLAESRADTETAPPARQPGKDLHQK
mgnify:CR=1 FL=1